MVTKIALRRYFWIVLFALTLAACAPAQTTPAVNATDVQTTAVAIVQTGVALTQAALPTVTPLSPTFTPTPEITFALGTPIPTLVPPPILTPDTIQVERWREYQTELAKALITTGTVYQQRAICEWDILGRSDQEVYVWAFCTTPEGEGGNSRPAVIYLDTDGSISKIRLQKSNDEELFPADVREKFLLYGGYSRASGRLREMLDHLNYRGTHPDVPPLIILSAIPIATPTP